MPRAEGPREGRALVYVSRGALNDLAHAYRLGYRLGKLSRERQLVEGDKLHRRTLHLYSTFVWQATRRCHSFAAEIVSSKRALRWAHRMTVVAVAAWKGGAPWGEGSGKERGLQYSHGRACMSQRTAVGQHDQPSMKTACRNVHSQVRSALVCAWVCAGVRPPGCAARAEWTSTCSKMGELSGACTAMAPSTCEYLLPGCVEQASPTVSASHAAPFGRWPAVRPTGRAESLVTARA